MEITDIRIWNSDKGTWLESRESPGAEQPDPNAAEPAPAEIP
ncbi:MAG TPA: hypothetical protein VMX36_07170 [Sedimentisphaerales bacterium]|nr:hypothetical protein [Sedimentisphaerales bacterium]